MQLQVLNVAGSFAFYELFVSGKRYVTSEVSVDITKAPCLVPRAVRLSYVTEIN